MIRTKKPASYKKIQKSILFKYKEDRMTGNNGLCAVVKKQNPRLLHHCRELAWSVSRLRMIFS